METSKKIIYRYGIFCHPFVVDKIYKSFPSQDNNDGKNNKIKE